MRHSNAGPLTCQIEQLRQRLAQDDQLPLADLLTPQRLTDFAQAHPQRAQPQFPVVLTLTLFLRQILRDDQTCRQAVFDRRAEQASSGHLPCSAATGGYCKARARLDEDALHTLVTQTGDDLHHQAPHHWRWKGRLVKVADGTTVTAPDTPANQSQYPQPDGQKKGLGFPMLRLVGLFCLATGVLLQAALAAYQGKGSGELSLLRQIWDTLQPDDVLLADRLFCSYFEIAVLKQRGVDVVLRLHQSRKVDFRAGRRLGRRDQIVSWNKPARPDWLSEDEYQRLPAVLAIRQVDASLSRRGFRTEKVLVVTTLLDAQQYPPSELGELHWQRWRVELDLRAIKVALKMEPLRCKSPAMVRKELWVHMLAYNVVRGQIAEAARRAGLSPYQLSFTAGVQWLRSLMGQPVLSERVARVAYYVQLLSGLASHQVDNRPDRNEPRAVKRRKKYPLLTEPRAKARQRKTPKRKTKKKLQK